MNDNLHKNLNIVLKHNIKSNKYIFPIVILLISMILLKDIMLFLVLTTLGFILNYFLNKYRLPFDVSPFIFLSLVISIKYNIFYMILFLIVAGIIPSILSGGELTAHTFIFMVHLVILNSIFSYLHLNYNLLLVLYPLGLIATLLFSNRLTNLDILRKISITTVSSVVTFIYILNLGGFLL